MTETRLKIAVFIDFDNIEIGVKTTLNQQFDISVILEAIKERGEVITKVAYGDWKRAGDHGRLLSQHAIRMDAESHLGQVWMDEARGYRRIEAHDARRPAIADR